jgi:DNA modification methylase
MKYQIVVKHQIQRFKISIIDLPSIEAAIWWVVEQTNSYRHLNLFQRIEMGLKALPHYEKLAKENQKLAGKHKGELQTTHKSFNPINCMETIGKAAGACDETVSSVRYIREHGKPDEIEECRSGKVKIHSMHKQIRDRIEATEEWKRKRNGAHDDVIYTNPHADEYYQQVIQGDCIQTLKRMHLDSINNIDMTIFSPPYHGASIDYGSGYADFTHYEEYLNWLKDLIYCCQNVGNEGMRLCIIVDAMNRKGSKDGEDYQYTVISDLIRIVHELNAEHDDCKLRYFGDFFWIKNHAGGARALGSFSPMKPVLRNDAEYIMVWVKGQKEFQNINEKAVKSSCENPDWLLSKDEYQKFSLKTWNIAANNDSYRHPAKFPYEIPYRLIKLLTFPGQVVLDPLCGSAVSLRASKDLGRKWIGIEQNSSYCQMAQDRLAEKSDKHGEGRVSA